mgnify:CR=1 FL=1
MVREISLAGLLIVAGLLVIVGIYLTLGLGMACIVGGILTGVYAVFFLADLPFGGDGS